MAGVKPAGKIDFLSFSMEQANFFSSFFHNLTIKRLKEKQYKKRREKISPVSNNAQTNFAVINHPGKDAGKKLKVKMLQLSGNNKSRRI